MRTGEQIDGIRSVRLAAHELRSACAALVGGTEMAISTATVEQVGRPVPPRVTQQLKRGARQ